MNDTQEEKVAVVAIGGNSLIKDKQHQTVEDQYQAAKETTMHIADMIEAGWDVAIGHGNGPQVGFILRRSEIATKVEGHARSAAGCVRRRQPGRDRLCLQQTLQNELHRRGIKKNVATVITQVLVDKEDPAFKNPSKPIGGFMDEAEASAAPKELGGAWWKTPGAAGGGWWLLPCLKRWSSWIGQDAGRCRRGGDHRRRRRHPGDRQAGEGELPGRCRR
jgi:carbamate kinase